MKDKNKSKKDKVLGSNKKKRFRIELLIPVFVIIIGGVFIFNTQSEEGEINFGNTFVTYENVKAENGIITIPVSNFNDNQAKYFKYDFNDITIFFFALKSSDGVIRSAFDSCDVCFREQKGYRQDGDNMICNNCGQVFPSVRINVEKGGCNPAPLNRQIEGNNLVLNVTDLYDGAVYF